MKIDVKETKNYGMFKRLEGNRDVKCVKKIMDSIEKVGYIPNPIIVNEKMEIIDGQNRLEALKTLNLPIYYIIHKGIGIEEARSLNLGRTNWKPLDYVRSYAEEGRKSYKLIMQLIEDYPSFKFQEIVGIATNNIITSGWILKKVEEGTLELTDKEFLDAKKKLDIMSEMSDALNRIVGTRRLYITAIAWCFNIKGVNKSRLAKVITEKYPLLRPVCETDMFLKDLSDIYNKGLEKSKQMFFDFEYKTK